MSSTQPGASVVRCQAAAAFSRATWVAAHNACLSTEVLGHLATWSDAGQRPPVSKLVLVPRFAAGKQ